MFSGQITVSIKIAAEPIPEAMKDKGMLTRVEVVVQMFNRDQPPKEAMIFSGQMTVSIRITANQIPGVMKDKGMLTKTDVRVRMYSQEQIKPEQGKTAI